MAAFATYQDVEARWRPLSESEQATATTLLDDASAIIRSECPSADALDDGITRLVVCGMVKRAMIAAAAGEGVSQFQQTAGPFSQNATYSNPMGNLYLTKQDRKLLGCGGQGAFDIDQGTYGGESLPLNWWELNL